MIQKVFKERLVWTVLLSSLFCVVISMIKPARIILMDLDAVNSRRFWIRKVFPGKKFNMVIMGDSRAYRGLSPAIMSSLLPGISIHNFGFSSGGLNPEMYAAVEKLLDRSRKINVVLLAISPLSLTGQPEETPKINGGTEFFFKKNEHYHTEVNRPKDEIIQSLYIDPVFKKLQPFSLWELLRSVFGNLEMHEKTPLDEYYDDGWMASNETRESLQRYLKIYRDLYKKTRASPSLVNELVSRTREWRETGILSFAFIVPTCMEMEELEKKRSGLDQGDLKDRFQNAGGIWLNIDSSEYHSYDASHLKKESAVRLSREVARQIREYLKRNGYLE